MQIRKGWMWFQACLRQITFAATALGLLAACAPTRTSGLSEKVLESPAKSTQNSLKSQAEQAWLDREDPERLLEAILLYKKIHQAEPGNREVLVRLSRALYFHADGYLTRDEERLARFDQGTYYGEKAMALNPEFKAQLDKGRPLLEALNVLGPNDLEGAYWTAANLGKWSKLKGSAAVLKNKALVQRLLEKVTALDESFFYGATSRYWGVFYAAAPAFAGGDLKKSRTYFDRSLQLAPNYFATRVLMAEMYATRVGDEKLFDEQLKYVLEGAPNVIPEMVPEQKVEQRKARELLARKKEFFPPH